MHAPLPTLPHHPLIAGLVALLAGLLVLLAAAPDLGTLDFSLGGGGAPTAEPAIPANPQVTAPPEPTWATDPLAPPLEGLAGAAR